MAATKTKFLGATDYYNFDPEDDQAEGLKHVVIWGKKLGVEPLASPVCGFTTAIVDFSDTGNFEVEENVYRSKKPADGVIVDTYNDGVAMFNADCPIVAILETSKRKLAVLHAGFRCLVPEKPRRGNRPSGIIQTLFEKFSFNPRHCQAFFGFGIGPCCYGAEHWPEINDVTMDLRTGIATRGPRAGQRSIDLYELIKKQLLDMKIEEGGIGSDFRCTSCARTAYPNGNKFLYHSKARDGLAAGRNAVIVWMANQ